MKFLSIAKTAWLLLGLLVAISYIVRAIDAHAQTASLLPNGMQQFADANGAPYAAGKVYFYIPNTTTPKTTWIDPNQSVANTNPVILDAAGRATIYGAGQYRQLLLDQFGNTIWDKLTYGQGVLTVPSVFLNTITSLRALSLAGLPAGYAVGVNGYYTSGDMPYSVYHLQMSGCTLNAGAGDGGSQIPSNTASNCWLLNTQTTYNPKQWGAVDGSATTSITGSMSASGTLLTLSAAGDFINGQPIALVGAGLANAQTQPTNLTLTALGSTSTALTYWYTISAIDQNLGVGVAIAPVSVANANNLCTNTPNDTCSPQAPFTFTASGTANVMTVSATTGVLRVGQKIWGVNRDLGWHTYIVNQLTGGAGSTGTYTVASANAAVTSQTWTSEQVWAGTPGVSNQLSWTAASGNPKGYAMWRGSTNVLANMVCMGVTSGQGDNGTSWQDLGANNWQTCPSWVPVHPPTVATNDTLQTTIVSGAGTTTLQVAAPAQSTVASGVLVHDSSVAVTNIAALGLPIAFDCGQFNIFSSIGLTASRIEGGGQNCTTMQFYNAIGAAIAQTGSDTEISSLAIDASQTVANFGITVTGSRTRDTDIDMFNVYNMIKVSTTPGTGGSVLNSVFENIIGRGILRGDYGVQLITDASNAVQNVHLTNVSIAGSSSAISYLEDGAVNGTRGKTINTQSSPHEWIFRNTVNASTGGISFGMFDHSGSNFAWNDNVAMLQSAQEVTFTRFYNQGNIGNIGPGVYIGPGVGAVTFQGGTVVNNNDLDGLEIHGQATNNDGTTLVYGNSQITNATADKVYIAKDARNGQGWVLPPGDNFGGASAQPSERYGVHVQSGFPGGAGPTYVGNPLVSVSTAGGGVYAPVCDESGSNGMVLVNGTQSPGTCSNQVVNQTAGVTYSAAQFVPSVSTNIATIYRSGQSAGVTDTTPTAALILALPQMTNHTAGTKFQFQLDNKDSHAVTLAGGTGVTIAGTAPTVGFTNHDYTCAVDGGGSTITCTGN